MSKLTVKLIDGTEETTDVIMPDRIRFDLTRRRRDWPEFGDAPFLGMSFWAWAALTREQKTQLPFDEWIKTVSDIEEPKSDDEEVDPGAMPGNPTDPANGPAY